MRSGLVTRGLTALVLSVLAAPGLAAEPTVAKIGVLTDMSGPYGDAAGQGSVVAAQLAIEDFGGSVLGHPIELVSADHQNDAAVGSNIARQWFDLEGVTLITDLTNSAVAIAVQNIAAEKKRIDLITSTATTAVTNEQCSPYGAHWTFDSYALSAGTAGALVEQGGKSWFFITADYTFGQNLEATATKRIVGSGGNVVGSALAPLNTTDFSSQLLQAQASGADVIGLANAGADTANSVKQAKEFGLTQQIAAFLPFITDIRSIGLQDAQGLVLTTAFYWDRTEESRAFAKRFEERQGAVPTMIQAGTYSAVLHYLKAVEAAGSLDADAVIAKIREIPVNDAVFQNATVREDGQVLHDMYLVKVKTPEESKSEWDLYTILATIPADKAWLPLAESKCPLVKVSN
jgi:branched-chain amino acid transport system substrate-binding protein